MKMHYKVRSVLLSHAAAALTLEPVEWVKDSDTEWMEESDGTKFRPWVECDPSDPKAEPTQPGGKMTELRIEGATDWKPGDYMTLTVEHTVTSWPHDDD